MIAIHEFSDYTDSHRMTHMTVVDFLDWQKIMLGAGKIHRQHVRGLIDL